MRMNYLPINNERAKFWYFLAHVVLQISPVCLACCPAPSSIGQGSFLRCSLDLSRLLPENGGGRAFEGSGLNPARGAH